MFTVNNIMTSLDISTKSTTPIGSNLIIYSVRLEDMASEFYGYSPFDCRLLKAWLNFPSIPLAEVSFPSASANKKVSKSRELQCIPEGSRVH